MFSRNRSVSPVRPWGVYVAFCGLLWLAVMVVIGVVDAFLSISGLSTKNIAATLVLASLGVVLIVWMVFIAKALLLRRQWSRAAGLVVAVLSCGVGMASIQGEHPAILLAVALLIPAVSLVFGLLAKSTTKWLVADTTNSRKS